MEYSDEELIERITSGYIYDFDILYDRYKIPIFNLVYRYLENVEDAEDVLTETFIYVYKGLETFKGQSKFSTWLYRIAILTAYNFNKKRAKYKSNVTQLVPDLLHDRSAERIYEQQEIQNMVQKAIRDLPDNYRIILLLREIEGFSYNEIAQILNCSVKKVSGKHHNAREAFKKKYVRYLL